MFNKYLKDKILLNSGRNCLRYLIKKLNINEINIPYYICPAVWRAIRAENVRINFYYIDDDFLPIKNFDDEDYILYPNYFGICGRQNNYLSHKYCNLISDNAHAFFAERSGIASMYSPRKFFNVNDGGILDVDFNCVDFFEKDEDSNIIINNYESFCKNEISIDNRPIKFMSDKTKEILQNENFEDKKIFYRQLFDKFHSILKEINLLNISISDNEVPMSYPLLVENPDDFVSIFNSNNLTLLKYWGSCNNMISNLKINEHLINIPLNEAFYGVLLRKCNVL